MSASVNEAPRVVIIGLGYVGLTLGVALARRGVSIAGIEKREDVVASTNRGEPHFSEVGLQAALASVVASGTFHAARSTENLSPADYYIITVGTPLRAGSVEPRLDMIEDATREVAAHMPDGATVILRSTVRVGTTRDIVAPILKASGKRFHLAMCPERTLEGDALRELAELPQIVGGSDEIASDRAAALFSRLTHTIVRVDGPETAEMIKLVDNTSRDVRFAFANEVARACDALGINAQDVIRFGKLGYARTNVALPGLVGGPCLEKDPHILLASVAPRHVTLEITAASRAVNERQPRETIDALIARAPNRPLVVIVAGLAFKGVPETDDLRGSMSLHVIDALIASGRCAEIRAYDPVVPLAAARALPQRLSVYDDLYAACEGADLLVIANNHPIFGRIDLDRIYNVLAPDALIYDYWNNLGQYPAGMLRARYLTVGNINGKF